MNRFILVSLLMFSINSAAETETKEFDGKGLGELKVENLSGDTIVKGTEAEKAMVLINRGNFSEKCKLTSVRTGKTLIVKVERSSAFSFNEECEVEFEISVPKSVNLNIAVGSGKIRVNGVQGNLAFKIGSGDISADGDFKKINGTTGSGDVDVKGLSGGGEVQTGSGAVHLTYAVSPSKGELEIKTGSGNSTLLFPIGAKIQTTFAAGSGELNNELGDTDKAPFKISMKAGSGNLKIRSY